jgi:predicted nucleotidyltransferase component of viral defense system
MQEAALKRLAGKCKVPVGTVEKDYILSLMLVILSNSDLASTIVFKGGTYGHKEDLLPRGEIF